MPNANYQTLSDAIARNGAGVISLPSAGMVRHHKTRFLAEAEKGFWLESAAADRPLIDALMAEKTAVGIAFKSGTESILFVATILSRDEHFHVSADVSLEALLVEFPKDFQRKQRRQAYRVVLPKEHQIGLRLWRIPEHAVLRDRPLASLEISGRLEDLSVGGMAVRCAPGRDGQPAKALANERLRVQLTWSGTEILTEGRVMHKRVLEDKHAVLGVQLKKLEKDLEGRQTLVKLTELVGYLQRDEIKRRSKTKNAE